MLSVYGAFLIGYVRKKSFQTKEIFDKMKNRPILIEVTGTLEEKYREPTIEFYVYKKIYGEFLNIPLYYTDSDNQNWTEQYYGNPTKMPGSITFHIFQLSRTTRIFLKPRTKP